MQRLFIVDRDLFAGMNIPQREEEHVTIKSLHVGVRLAAVIDVMRAVAAAAAVQTPMAVDVADAQDGPSARPLSRFEIGDSLACVLSDLAAAPKRDRRETALAVDW